MQHRLLATATGLALLALTPAAALAQGLDPARAALEARVLELEEELRRVNGRVEELEYEQSRLLDRLERLVGDVDNRLSAVEPGAAAPEEGAAAAPPQLTPRPQARIVGSDDGDDAPPPPAAPAEPAAPAAPGGGTAGAPRRLSPAVPPPARTARAAPAAPAPDVQPDASAARGYVLGTIPREAAAGGRPAPAGPATAALPPEEVGYEGALDLLQRGRWPEAEAAFAAFLEANPQDPRASSAAYWQAETHYFRKDYGTAAASFARNYRTYGPDAQKAPENLLKLGMSLAALGDKGKACQTYAELGRRHPNAAVPVRQTLARERAAAACA